MQLINVTTSTFGSSLGKVINDTFLLNNVANDVKYRCIHNPSLCYDESFWFKVRNSKNVWRKSSIQLYVNANLCNMAGAVVYKKTKIYKFLSKNQLNFILLFRRKNCEII